MVKFASGCLLALATGASAFAPKSFSGKHASSLSMVRRYLFPLIICLLWILWKNPFGGIDFVVANCILISCRLFSTLISMNCRKLFHLLPFEYDLFSFRLIHRKLLRLLMFCGRLRGSPEPETRNMENLVNIART